MLGQLVPPLEDATIEVQTADVAALRRSAGSDALGRFRLELAAGGTVRLRVTRPAGPAVETSWAVGLAPSGRILKKSSDSPVRIRRSWDGRGGAGPAACAAAAVA